MQKQQSREEEEEDVDEGVSEKEDWELVPTALPSPSTSFIRDRQEHRRGHFIAWHLERWLTGTLPMQPVPFLVSC